VTTPVNLPNLEADDNAKARSTSFIFIFYFFIFGNLPNLEADGKMMRGIVVA
jgi:hypothetical protein